MPVRKKFCPSFAIILCVAVKKTKKNCISLIQWFLKYLQQHDTLKSKRNEPHIKNKMCSILAENPYMLDSVPSEIVIVLYTVMNNDNDNNNNTRGLGRFKYERIYFFCIMPLATQEELYNSLRPILIILCGHLRHARHILWCIKSQFITSGRDPNWSDLIKSEKVNRSLRLSNLDSRRFKSLKFSGHLFRTQRHPPTQFTPTARPASFPVWEFIMADDDCHILSVRACKKDQETPKSSKPYQTK